MFFLFNCSGANRDLHSFPTRRSSDLGPLAGLDVRPLQPVRGTGQGGSVLGGRGPVRDEQPRGDRRSEEHTSELQSLTNLVCRLLLEKKNNRPDKHTSKRQPPLHSIKR